MTIEPASVTGQLSPQQVLFTPGPRVGWTFRSHRDLIPAFGEPPPDAGTIRDNAIARAGTEQRRWQRAQKWALRPSLMVLVGFTALGGCAHALNPAAPFVTTIITAIVLAAPGTGWAGWRYWQLQMAKTTDPRRLYDIAHAGWAQRAAEHEQAGLAQVAHIPEWGSAVPATRRTDIFGGTLEGWASLHIVHGASLMAERPLLVADLTGQNIAASLAALARDAGADTAEYLLPQDLDRSGLLARLSPGQLAGALAEAIHAGAGQNRADRAVDVRVLEQLCQALAGERITPARLAAGVDAALGREPAPGLLTEEEKTWIGGKLFGDTLRPQITANLIRLDAFLSDLAKHAPVGAPARDHMAWCTIFAAEPAARGARAEVINAILIQWLTVMTATAGTVPAVIVAGADDITRRHLEALTDACDRRQAPLTLLFRHLRDDATTLIGGGTAAFMQLGNHHEAEQAAAYIGKGHKFVLSGHTTTRGGDRSRTTGSNQNWGTSDSRGTSTTSGWSSGTSTSPVPSEHLFGGSQTSWSSDRSGSTTRSRERSSSYSYGTEESSSEGSNWSDAASTERVYEYTVEPTVLQTLPENALLLVNRTASTSLQPVDCHPDIVTFPSLTTSPHQPVTPAPSASADHRPAAIPPDEQPALTPPQPQWPGMPAQDRRRHARPPRRQPRTPWWEQHDPPPG
jgi:hypothetical protein